jgi:transcriptional regulator with XRE-family HTH domain
MSRPLDEQITTPAGKLRRLRFNRGLSQTRLARTVGLEPKTVSRIEQGERPSAKSAFLLATYFKLEPTDIWDEDGIR